MALVLKTEAHIQNYERIPVSKRKVTTRSPRDKTSMACSPENTEQSSHKKQRKKGRTMNKTRDQDFNNPGRCFIVSERQYNYMDLAKAA
jgi:hypothetical protein